MYDKMFAKGEIYLMEQLTQILVVDDNPEIREIITILLSAEGFGVTDAPDGDAALKLLAEQSFDLIILDVMMPHLNGYQTCVKIREQTNAPILFLSARTADSDKTLGFSSGGDDYLAKPFSYSELVSRVKALLRRYQVYQGKTADAPPAQTEDTVLTVRHLSIHTDTSLVLANGVPVELTDTEYALLWLLAVHPKQIFSAEHLYESVWKEPYYHGAANTVMVHIRNLRKKIEPDPKNPSLIKTVWGRGYRCD